jgi:hypothetical protein
MTFGNLARVSALLALAGCITSGPARDEEYAIFRSKGAGYLRVSLDRNEYQSNNAGETGTQKGSLSDDDWQRVQELTSDEKLEVYVGTSAEDRAACIDDPNAFALSTRKSLGGCWVPADVSDAETQEMLDFFVPLLQAHVPNEDGTPMDNDDDQAPRDAGRRDASSAGKDAGK